MRDALKFGRLLGEAAVATIEDPISLDQALANWERARDRDTISTYHWGNRESRPGASTPLVREVLRTFAGSEGPDLSDTFNRARPIEAIIAPSRMVRGLAQVLQQPDVDRRALLHELKTELPMEVTARRHRLLDGFRSTRPTATERDGWQFGDSRPPSFRAASDPVVRDAPDPAQASPSDHRTRSTT